MGFLEGLKAGFLGAAGVDYYSMKNNEVLRDIRGGRGTGRLDMWSDPAEWLVGLQPYIADLDHCLTYTRWVLLHQPESTEAALERLRVATDGVAIFFASQADDMPLDLMKLLVGVKVAAESWGSMADEWLVDRDTPKLLRVFELRVRRWNRLSDEVHALH